MSGGSISSRPFLGGPSSSMPRQVETFLCWSVCVSCLGVSGYQYCVSSFIKPFWNSMFTGTLGFFRSRDHMLEESNGSRNGSGSSGGSRGGSGRNNRRLAELKMEAHG
eukprot:411298_1